MKNKIGPYGTHNGVGCYTKNCSYRDATEAGIKPPLTYEEADRALMEATYSGNSGSGWKKTQVENEAKRKIASDSRDATPEGIKILKKSLVEKREALGKNDTQSIYYELRLSKAKKNQLLNDQKYRSDVFQAAKEIENIDLKRLASNSDRYHYDNDAVALVDKTTGKVVAAVVDGSLYVKTPNSNETLSADSSNVAKFQNIKNLLAAAVDSDVIAKASKSKTPSQLLKDNLKEATEEQTSAGSLFYLQDTAGKKRLVVHYDKDGEFLKGVYAKEDGRAQELPKTHIAGVISFVRSKSFFELPELPSWF